MKRNWFLRAAALLVIGSLFSLCAVSTTLARYVGTFDGATIAVRAGVFRVYVAQYGSDDWHDMTATQTITTTNNLGGPLLNASTLQPRASTWISNTNGSLIAPGSAGRIDLAFFNQSEVTVRVMMADTTSMVHIGAATSDILTANFQFSVDGTTWRDTLALAMVDAAGEYVELEPGEYTDDWMTLYWRWRFYVDEDQDEADTALGRAAATATAGNAPGARLTIVTRAVQVLSTD